MGNDVVVILVIPVLAERIFILWLSLSWLLMHHQEHFEKLLDWLREQGS